MLKPHFWEGRFIDDAELASKLETLDAWLERSITRPFDISALLQACDRYSQSLIARRGNHAELVSALTSDGKLNAQEAADMLGEIAAFLSISNLKLKLKRELGSSEPFTFERSSEQDSLEQALFEAWAPLGFIVHVAPSNAASVGPMSVLEGLLSGNVNFLKTSGSDGPFAALFLKGLVDQDATLGARIICARISSREQATLSRVFSFADGIAAWGGEEAVESVRKLAPSGARVVDWGHKISFAYVSVQARDDKAMLDALAKECCLFEQQACSSPQCVYVETDDWNSVRDFGEKLGKALGRVSESIPQIRPVLEEQAEITLVTELARENASLSSTLSHVIENGKNAKSSWRVIVDARPALSASPLFRTVWVKPLPRAKILSTLRPMRAYLQTAGLSCGIAELGELSQLLVKAGAVRVRRIGEMPGSYSGEPHDGVYALPRYCKRVSLQAGNTPAQAAGIKSFADLTAAAPPAWVGSKEIPPILRKADFQEAQVDPRLAHLNFKSGGSSGEPKLSVFTYDDYRDQMKLGAEGLYAAGLDPLTDRCMNLFFCGSLYGGFLSVFSMLEELRAIHFPMAAIQDLKMVSDAVVKNKITVLMGMPSYLIQLFDKHGTELAAYGGVKKIFYGGEAFNDAQRRFLRERFGVQSIKSVGYGSVDAGPLGYQCVHCDGGVHHLQQKLQYLEIVEVDHDRPVARGEVGRLIFTSKMRQGQRLDRYEIGDIGQWIEKPCECGRAAPLFRLLGRTGDVIRIASIFLNYQKVAQIFSEKLEYAGGVQLLLTTQGLGEKLTIRLAEGAGLDAARVRETLLACYDDLNEVVTIEKLLALEIVLMPSEQMEKTKGSGKLMRIVDWRER